MQPLSVRLLANACVGTKLKNSSNIFCHLIPGHKLTIASNCTNIPSAKTKFLKVNNLIPGLRPANVNNGTNIPSVKTNILKVIKVPQVGQMPERASEFAAGQDAVAQHQQLVMHILEDSEPSTAVPESLHALLGNVWAPSTVLQRRNLWRRLMAFRLSRPLESLDRSAAVFVSQLKVLPSTQLTYAKAFSAMMGQLQLPCPTTKLTIRAFGNNGASIPTRQAVPALRADVDELMRRLQPRLAFAVWLCWKTAARFSDVMGLSKESFIAVASHEIIIRWGVTKSNRTLRFKPTQFTVILDRQPMHNQVQLIQGMRPLEKVTQLTTPMFVRAIQRWCPTLTAHSFKRGAIQVLFNMAERGLINPRIIPLLAKHQDRLMDFPESTLRYAPNQETFARVLGTGMATYLL